MEREWEATRFLPPTHSVSDVERSLMPESAYADPVTGLNATLEGRYAIERELGEGGIALRVRAIYDQSLKERSWIPGPTP